MPGRNYINISKMGLAWVESGISNVTRQDKNATRQDMTLLGFFVGTVSSGLSCFLDIEQIKTSICKIVRHGTQLRLLL